jgi:2',3'-cyclic-nucleotide 2'-phosphodiesterase (5'-nucleotidase family)
MRTWISQGAREGYTSSLVSPCAYVSLEYPSLNIQTIISPMIGGHSHTLLGHFPEALGPYPTIETNLDGEEVFIVTAWRWGQVLGYINVAFEAAPNGRVLAYTGGPIAMDKTIKQDPALQAKVNTWRKPFDDYAKEVIGFITDVLDETKCQQSECELSLLCFSKSSDGHVRYTRKLHL